MSKYIVILAISLFFYCGCKFAIKEYTSSIGELTAETIKGTNP